MKARLLILDGPMSGTSFSMLKAPFVMGRYKKCDLQIEDSRISNFHCRISNRGDVFYIEDIGSTNGTFLNEEKVATPSKLNFNDIVRIGDTRVCFTSPSEKIADPKNTEFEDKSCADDKFFDSQVAFNESHVGDYEIVDKIGEGTSSEIFKACNERTQEIVALKIFRRSKVDEETIKRFIHEAQICTQFDHPKIVKVVDFAMYKDRPLLVMEFIYGIPLDEYVKENSAFSSKRALRIGGQIAYGLHYVHERKVVHRDVKPSNVLLENDLAGIKIIDFGLVKISGQSITGASQMLGTVRYMPPEQIESSHKVDARADIYSLGALLYHIISGAPPYSHIHKVNAMIYEISNEKLKPLREIANVPNSVSDLVARAMAKNKEDRYQTAQELFQATVQILKTM